MNNTITYKSIVLLCLAAGTAVAHAQPVISIEIPTEIRAGVEFQYRLNFDGDANSSVCGLHSEIAGLGNTLKQFRVWHPEGVRPPILIKQTIAQAGVYTIEAAGKRVMSSLGCIAKGARQITVLPALDALPLISASTKAPTDNDGLRSAAAKGDTGAALRLGNFLANSGEDKEADRKSVV